MNKKLLSIIIIALLMLPTTTFAHTELSNSNPEAGQIVTEETKEISLTFGGEIEALSTMTLTIDGQEIPFLSVLANGNQLVGQLQSPLENGSYVIQWSIAGEDGHPITGEIPFEVQLPNENQDTEIDETTDQTTDDQINVDEVPNSTTEEAKEGSNTIKILVPIVAVLLLVIGMATLFRKKK